MSNIKRNNDKNKEPGKTNMKQQSLRKFTENVKKQKSSAISENHNTKFTVKKRDNFLIKTPNHPDNLKVRRDSNRDNKQTANQPIQKITVTQINLHHASLPAETLKLNL